MKLKRNMMKYLYIYYLPSGLFVVVSWVGFLIPPEVVPGRMAMLITLFLVLINIFNIVTSNSPNVEGMTAIAAWMLVCIFFVFGALVGYAYLLWKKKKSCLKRKRTRKLSEDDSKFRQILKEDYRSKVDDVFFVVFPIMFLVFNLIYWPLCLSSRQGGPQSFSVQENIVHDIISISTGLGAGGFEKSSQTFGRFGAPLGIYTTRHDPPGAERELS